MRIRLAEIGMSRRWFRMAVLLLACLFGILACARHTAQYSASARRLMGELDRLNFTVGTDSLPQKLPERLVSGFLIQNDGGQFVVRGMLSVDASFDPVDLDDLGVSVRNRLDAVLSVMIPLSVLDEVGGVHGIRKIDIDIPVQRR